MNETIIGIDPAWDPPFKVTQAVDYFPGRDYPDRDVWLAKRCNHVAGYQVYGRWVYKTTSGKHPKPFAVGINVAKRRAVTEDIARGGTGNPKRCRRNIVQHRHGYYRDQYEARQS